MKILPALIALLALASCTTSKNIQVTSKPLDLIVVKQAPPRDVNLADPHWIVVTPDNFEAVKEKYSKGGKFVVYGVTPTDYKKILKNQAELKRYIDQQKAIIVFYEKATNAK